MIEADLYEHLKANVPTVNNRVFANVFEQDTTKPALVYTMVEEHADSPALGGGCGGDANFRRWEITIYDDKYIDIKTVKNEVIAALKSFSVNVKDIIIEDGFVEEAMLFSQIITFHTGKRK